MKKLFENWRKFTNEARIATKDGFEEVKPSRGDTKHFFAYKSGKGYIITHKPSGKAVSGAVTKYGSRLSDLKKVMKDIEDANIPGIGDENPSIETLQAIKDVLKDGNPYLKESDVADAAGELEDALRKQAEEEEKRREEEEDEEEEQDRELKNLQRNINQQNPTQSR
tara:strand:+ start:1096 stop:1596 length:501 start_codon:yes stop_codon:yes gene_type:complete